MPFILLGPPDRVYSFENIPTEVKPQHQEIFCLDRIDNFDQRLTIYTGDIDVRHGAGEDEVDLTFQYPLLGFFQLPGGGNAIGILPINDPLFNQFRSAVANASVNLFQVKDTLAIVGVFDVAADLFQIELNNPPRQVINAVVLSGRVTSMESQVVTVTYRVSVLERLNQNPPIQPPIWILPGGWTGKYNLDASGALGPLLRSGIPQSP